MYKGTYQESKDQRGRRHSNQVIQIKYICYYCIKRAEIFTNHHITHRKLFREIFILLLSEIDINIFSCSDTIRYLGHYRTGNVRVRLTSPRLQQPSHISPMKITLTLLFSIVDNLNVYYLCILHGPLIVLNNIENTCYAFRA